MAFRRSSVPGSSIPSGDVVSYIRPFRELTTPPRDMRLPQSTSCLGVYHLSTILVGRISREIHRLVSLIDFVFLFSSDISLKDEAVSTKKRTKRNGRNKAGGGPPGNKVTTKTTIESEP